MVILSLPTPEMQIRASLCHYNLPVASARIPATGLPEMSWRLPVRGKRREADPSSSRMINCSLRHRSLWIAASGSDTQKGEVTRLFVCHVLEVSTMPLLAVCLFKLLVIIRRVVIRTRLVFQQPLRYQEWPEYRHQPHHGLVAQLRILAFSPA